MENETSTKISKKEAFKFLKTLLKHWAEAETQVWNVFSEHFISTPFLHSLLFISVQS